MKNKNKSAFIKIEKKLLNHNQVTAIAIVDIGSKYSISRVIIFCSLQSGVTIIGLRQFITEHIVPADFDYLIVLKKHFPFLLNGYVDKDALSLESIDYSKIDSHELEYDSLYLKLKQIWMKVLSLPRVSPNYCFFNDLGGDSLYAEFVLDNIKKDLDISLPHFIIYRYRTLARLTEYIHRGGDKIVSIETLQTPSNNESPVIIFVPPVKGGVDTYNFALKSFPKNYGLLVLTYNIVDDSNKYFYSLDKLMNSAAVAIDQLQQKRISIFGYSIGGLLAYEIATRTKITNIKEIILLDIPPALRRKKNIIGLINNDIHLIFRNIKKNDRKALKVNLWHILFCHYYLFFSGNKIKKFEKKNTTTMAEAAHLRFYRQFNHNLFLGDMLLIRSADKLFNKYNYNWEKFVKGNITIERIKSTHFNMLNHSNIEELTSITVKYLEK